VTIQPPVQTIDNPEALKDLLGTSFHGLFDTVTTYKPKPDFAHRLMALDPEQQRAILQRVRMNDPTPRVSFRK
jgi:hypothetical protein